MIIELPDINHDKLAQLTPSEAQTLRSLLDSPEYKQLEIIAANYSPSANCHGTTVYDQDAFSNQRASVRLAEMRGWGMHRAALHAALNPTQKQEQIKENFQPVDAPDGPH